MDDSLFEDVKHPDNADDNDLFEDTPHPESGSRTLASVAEEQNQMMSPPDVSASRAALVGAGQGATLGFGEEITAPFVAAAGMAQSGLSKTFGSGEDALPTLPGEDTLAKFQRLMQEYRDVARAEQRGAQDQHPIAYTTGAVAGGLATPGLGAGAALKGIGTAGKATSAALGGGVTGTMAGLGVRAAGGAGVGYGLGGLAGAGEAEGSLEERLPQAAETAKMGAGIGAAIPIAGQAATTLAKGGEKLAELPFIERALEAYKRGRAGQSLYTEADRQAAGSALYGKSEKLFNRLKEIKDEVGEAISNKVKAADEAGTKIDITDDVNAGLAKLDEIEKTNPSTETMDYIKNVRAELKQMLDIKSPKREMFGVPEAELPEGISIPKPKEQTFEVAPSKAREIKQSMYEYTPANIKDQSGKVSPLVSKPAGVAQDVYSGVGTKLEEAVDNLSNNEKYGVVKDSLSKLLNREKRFENLNVEKINDKLVKLAESNNTGDKARRAFKETMDELKQLDPKLGPQLEAEILDATERLKLAKDIQSGGTFSGVLGTKRSMSGTLANVAGLAGRKTGIAPVAETATNFAKSVLKSDATRKGTTTYETQGADALANVSKVVEPYKFQRQVASAAENAEPEVLEQQADDIRKKYGKQGEQLATILSNMANENKDSRRALMFTILQNQAYRKMLGMTEEEAK